ncbi:hypothetical protein GCM10022224_066790 [Nonomuraea antimicrobica]|uniref:Uncharacterized protein n=1 Tax=Nonomuraea antimicrobica TaxID=561173 RepID=A0ABP7CK54_9ACTN
MTPDASASIGALLQLLGMPAPPLPDADPQALNASAARWISSANAQDGIGRGADGHVARVLTHNAGQAPDALAAAYTAEEGERAQVANGARAARLMGGAQMAGVGLVMAQNVFIISRLYPLLATQGLAAVPGAGLAARTVVTRLILRKGFTQLLESARRGPVTMFGRAARLLRTSSRTTAQPLARAARAGRGPMGAAPPGRRTLAARLDGDYLAALFEARGSKRLRTVYRADERAPEVIWREGFEPNPAGGWIRPLRVVFTSPELETAQAFVGHKGQVFEILAPGGSRPIHKFMRRDMSEVKFFGGIDTRYVKGVWTYPTVHGRIVTGKQPTWLPNPNFGPH